MHGLKQLADKAFLATQLVGAIGLIGLMLVVGGTVVYRWFGGTFQGSYEVAETCTIVTITMCIFMATVKRGHVDVRIVHDRLPRGIRRGTLVLIGVFSVVFWAVATWSVYLLAIRLTGSGEVTDVLRINIVPFRWVTVVGFAGVTLVLAWQAWGWIMRRDLDAASHDPSESYSGSEGDQ